MALDICELNALKAKLNYSLLDHLVLKREVEFSLVDGTEVYINEPADLQTSPSFLLRNTFSCRRVFAVQQVPQAAILPYHRWFMALKRGCPGDLQRSNYSYVSGLFVRPSLAENATHPVALREESIVKVWLPYLAQNRTSIVRTTPSLEKYTDSLGGRLGAPWEDTFFLDDTTIVPQAAQQDVPKVQQLPAIGNFLKIVIPIPTTQVKVHHHINDIVNDTISWLGRMASATFLFGLLQVIFPSTRKDKLHLHFHIPSLGLGTPGELDPLLAEQPETA
ncbi:unnamed protein product [Symbiodinium pilosum]|uniref:Uncharacterized protein n=1 Tax=Symbiodinium pilosum TaxID=2952 RepID=A0A812XRK1_SYMPI|nr:unnamed protein product [Symbiodinium pilosum]